MQIDDLQTMLRNPRLSYSKVRQEFLARYGREISNPTLCRLFQKISPPRPARARSGLAIRLTLSLVQRGKIIAGKDITIPLTGGKIKRPQALLQFLSTIN